MTGHDTQRGSACGRTRRGFLGRAAGAGAFCAAMAGVGTAAAVAGDETDGAMTQKATTLTDVDADFEREPLVRPFGFKGGYMSEIWQTAALMAGESGAHGIGLCTQSVLWSDASVFAAHSESGGNALMYAMTEFALRRARGMSFSTPIELLDAVLGDVCAYGKTITGNDALRKTFALNALVGFDNAAWLLYAAERGIGSFDDMIPPEYRPVLAHRHDRVAAIPLMAYGVPVSEIVGAVDDGFFFMKIKIGQPGSQEEMLEKDMARLSAIHDAIGGRETPWTEDGRLPYYFDANGRYETKEALLRLLDHADRIGARDRIAVIEEPFPEEYEADVGGMGVRIAADESAHTDTDAARRIEMGYGAIALKPIAKTLSMTLKIAKTAHERGIPCFCADLTVNPILVDWNKNVAARLAPFPGLGTGLLETNGHQNYRNWQAMKEKHPCAGASWTEAVDGVFELDGDFYERSGGIFLPSAHYEAMFGR